MSVERLRADLEALRGDVPQLRELVRDRAEAVLEAEAEGLSRAEVLELRRRHETALGLLRRQLADIEELQRELANGERGADEDPLEWALGVLRSHRRQFLADLDETEGVLLARLMAGRREEGWRHAG